MRRALLLRIATVRIWASEMRGRSALAVASAEPAARPALLRQIEADARAILRERAEWAAPMAKLLRAGVANLRGRRDRAVALLREAIYGFDAADMALYGARLAVAWQPWSAATRAEPCSPQTDAWFREQQVVSPDALTAMVAPGYDALNSAP